MDNISLVFFTGGTIIGKKITRTAISINIISGVFLLYVNAEYVTQTTTNHGRDSNSSRY